MTGAADSRALLAGLADRLSKASAMGEPDRRALCAQWRLLAQRWPGDTVDGRGEPTFLVSGWACRVRRLPGGHSQIVAFVMPGDLAAAAGQDADPFETVCVTAVRTIGVGALMSRFVDGTPTHPDLAAAVRLAEHRAENLVFDHLVRLGAMTAREGLAHLLLELHGRMSRADLGDAGRFTLPVGQRRLGEAMGLSAMHVNTTLKRLRRDGLIDLGAGWLQILDHQGLSEAARPAMFAVPVPPIAIDGRDDLPGP